MYTYENGVLTKMLVSSPRTVSYCVRPNHWDLGTRLTGNGIAVAGKPPFIIFQTAQRHAHRNKGSLNKAIQMY